MSYRLYERGLELAIEDVQRLKNQSEAGNYKQAYQCALDDALIRLKAMLERVKRDEYPHPTSTVQRFR